MNDGLDFGANNGSNNNTAMGQAFNQANQSQKQTQKTAQQNPTAGNFNDNPFGFTTGVSLSSPMMAYAPIRNAMGSEAYLKLSKKLKEMAELHNRNAALDIRVIELDRNVNANLHYASFLVCVQSKARKDLGVGFNTIIMEATGEELQPTQETYQNEVISIPIYSEEVDNNIFREEITKVLLSEYGTGVNLFYSDTAVIPADFNHEDLPAVESLLQNAAAAATNALIMYTAGGQFYKDLNLVSELKSRENQRGDADMTFLYRFDNLKKLDYLKLPVRSSIVAQSVTGYRRSNQTKMLNSGNGPRTITETTGFIELMPVAPRHAPNMYNPMTMMNQMPTQRLAPVLVLNSMTSQYGNSPACMMLNILVAADLNRQHGWVSAFHSKSGSKVGGIDLTDVTAITIDMPSLADPTKPEARPAVPAGGMPIEVLLKFLGTYCQPDMYIAVDVPVAAHTTWYMSLFMDAAKGVQSAIQAIDRAMDSLTNGEFTRTKPGALKMFATTPMLLERGYWELDGERRDVADVDYVAVCNYADANGDPAMVERWTNTFIGSEGDTAQRLHKRRQIIQDITGRTAVFVGRSVRVFFHGEYLAHGLKCLAAAGVTTSSDGRGSFGFSGGRAQADFLTGAALPSGIGWATNVNGGGNSSWGANHKSQWSTSPINGI